MKNIAQSFIFRPLRTIGMALIVTLPVFMAPAIAQQAGNISTNNNALKSAAAYYGAVATINTALYAGTTPKNPQLINKLQEAIQALTQMEQEVGGLQRQLQEIQGAGNTQAVNLLQNTIQRQNLAIDNEKHNLEILALSIRNADIYGPSLHLASVGAANKTAATPPLTNAQTNSPFVTIRFDGKTPPDYANATYQAIKRSLEIYPEAKFELKGLLPASSPYNLVQKQKEVAATLVALGLPEAKITQSFSNSANVTVPQLQIFLRK
ncbi:MAG: hypothetical protein ACOYK8_07940 [Alphaproteobacteria bacterium]